MGAAEGYAGKCERGRGNINADGAGAEVFAGDEHSRERLFCPMALISRLWRGGRIIIIRVRASCCGECALSPADLTTHSPPKAFAHPRTATRSSRAFSHSLPALFRSPTQRRRTPAGCAMHSPPTAQLTPRSDTLPLLPFRFGHKKTAPHSACAMPNVSVDRRCGRSFGLVSRALFAAVAGRWRVGVGLRPQPWALRSRRCGRVLRA